MGTIFYTKVYDSNFFSEEFIQKYIFDNKINLIEFIFIFDNIQWKTLVANFKNINIILSGGSTVSRHVLSPVQINLARFILGSEGLKETHKISKESFQIHKKLHFLYKLENFVKDKKIWLIRKYFNFFNEPYKPKLNESLILKLYHLYINSPYYIDYILYMIIYSEMHYYKNDHFLVHKYLLGFLERETAASFLDGPIIKNGNFFKVIEYYESKFFPINQRKDKLEDLLKEIKTFNEILFKKECLTWQIELETIKKQLNTELKYADKFSNFYSERMEKIKQDGEKEFKKFMENIKIK